MSELVKIVSLGHAGDGVTEDGRFVPYTLPGETVTIRDAGKRAVLETVLNASAERAAPPCLHFGVCGGCAVQHLSQTAYRSWKHALVATTLGQRGIAVDVEPMRFVGPGTRRRAMFKARNAGGKILLGFYEAESRHLIDLDSCPVLVPAIENLMPRLRTRLGMILRDGESAELHVTALKAGLDLALTLKCPRSLDLLGALAGLGQALKLARLSWNGEMLALSARPELKIGSFSVTLPIAPFLQPTEEGERILQALVKENLGDARRVADLFAGCGTFALVIAEGRSVLAADSGEEMIVALRDAARGRSNVTAEKRDLFRRPYAPEELNRFDAVVLDPPRPGAKAQVEALAASSVPRIVYVSCNPASFARDAAILIQGGYQLTRVTPLDQFQWSPHVELVGLFEREG